MTAEPAPRSPDRPRDHPVRCAPAAQARGDELAGTAPAVSRWFLVEQPGPWGRDALRQSRLPAGAATQIAAAAATQGARVLTIRRPGRQQPSSVRRWAVVDSRVGSESVRWGQASGPDGLVAAAAGQAPGTVSAEPLYLVCAHSRHDACCAVRGRAVAHALAGVRPGQVWECSHVGGDRFAANVVVLPHGLYYGHVAPADVGALADAYDGGLVLPELLRGRSTLPSPVQAAQAHARAATGERRVDALALLSWSQAGVGESLVRLDGDAEILTVGVRRVAAGPPSRLTCSATRLERPPAYELVSLERQLRSSDTA